MANFITNSSVSIQNSFLINNKQLTKDNLGDASEHFLVIKGNVPLNHEDILFDVIFNGSSSQSDHIDFSLLKTSFSNIQQLSVISPYYELSYKTDVDGARRVDNNRNEFTLVINLYAFINNAFEKEEIDSLDSSSTITVTIHQETDNDGAVVQLPDINIPNLRIKENVVISESTHFFLQTIGVTNNGAVHYRPTLFLNKGVLDTLVQRNNNAGAFHIHVKATHERDGVKESFTLKKDVDVTNPGLATESLDLEDALHNNTIYEVVSFGEVDLNNAERLFGRKTINNGDKLSVSVILSFSDNYSSNTLTMTETIGNNVKDDNTLFNVDVDGDGFITIQEQQRRAIMRNTVAQLRPIIYVDINGTTILNSLSNKVVTISVKPTGGLPIITELGDSSVLVLTDNLQLNDGRVGYNIGDALEVFKNIITEINNKINTDINIQNNFTTNEQANTTINEIQQIIETAVRGSIINFENVAILSDLVRNARRDVEVAGDFQTQTDAVRTLIASAIYYINNVNIFLNEVGRRSIVEVRLNETTTVVATPNVNFTSGDDELIKSFDFSYHPIIEDGDRTYMTTQSVALDNVLNYAIIMSNNNYSSEPDSIEVSYNGELYPIPKIATLKPINSFDKPAIIRNDSETNTNFNTRKISTLNKRMFNYLLDLSTTIITEMLPEKDLEINGKTDDEVQRILLNFITNFYVYLMEMISTYKKLYLNIGGNVEVPSLTQYNYIVFKKDGNKYSVDREASMQKLEDATNQNDVYVLLSSIVISLSLSNVHDYRNVNMLIVSSKELFDKLSGVSPTADDNILSFLMNYTKTRDGFNLAYPVSVGPLEYNGTTERLNNTGSLKSFKEPLTEIAGKIKQLLATHKNHIDYLNNYMEMRRLNYALTRALMDINNETMHLDQKDEIMKYYSELICVLANKPDDDVAFTNTYIKTLLIVYMKKLNSFIGSTTDPEFATMNRSIQFYNENVDDVITPLNQADLDDDLTEGSTMGEFRTEAVKFASIELAGDVVSYKDTYLGVNVGGNVNATAVATLMGTGDNRTDLATALKTQYDNNVSFIENAFKNEYNHFNTRYEDDGLNTA